MISRVLARAGWRVSSRALRRYRKERTVLAPPPAPTEPTKVRRPVIARFVHHTWMMDVSEVKQLLGGKLFMATVFDAFSRVPVAVETFADKPSASAMAKLLKRAARAFSSPKYVITDLGGEFTGKRFVRMVERIGSKHRTASADSIGATARLERFWLTIKDIARLRSVFLPLDQQELDERLAAALAFYICLRPHEGLGGATPAEALLGLAPAHEQAVEAPRGQRGQDVGPPPFNVHYLHPPTRTLPFLHAA